jgi:hypothetical protein
LLALSVLTLPRDISQESKKSKPTMIISKLATSP